jgi:hypothetical protein
MNGKVSLGPTPVFAEFSNTLPESQADIFSRHAISMAVFFGLHFAYRIQSTRGDRRPSGHVCGETLELSAVLGS